MTLSFTTTRRFIPALRRSAMTNTNRIWKSAPILACVCAVLTAGFFALQARAQDSRDGQWILESLREAGRYNLTLSYSSGRLGRGNNMSSSLVTLDRLRGLSQPQIMSAGSNVQFQLVREAGTFNCEGWFKDGKGAGHFVFAPSAAFSAELVRRGYPAPTEAQQFSLAMEDARIALRLERD